MVKLVSAQRYLIVFLVCVAFGLGVNWVGFGCVFPLVTDYRYPDRYKQIGSVDRLTYLLRAERLLFGWQPWNAQAINLKKLDGIPPGDVYVFNEKDVQGDAKESVVLPAKFVSFSSLMMDGDEIYVITEKIKNRNGSVSFLHFGYSRGWASVDALREVIVKQMSLDGGYLVPVARVRDCAGFMFGRKVCEKWDQDMISQLIEEWVETGNVPQTLEEVLLIPFIYIWNL